MYIKTASSMDLLKETIHMLKGFFGRVLFGKLVISSLHLVEHNNKKLLRKYKI
jgi:hypothetical protein